MNDQPEPPRHNDTERNLILNRALTDIDQIVNGHEPETDIPINDGIWNRLDKMAQDIEARSALSPHPPVTPEQAAQVLLDEAKEAYLEDVASSEAMGQNVLGWDKLPAGAKVEYARASLLRAIAGDDHE